MSTNSPNDNAESQPPEEAKISKPVVTHGYSLASLMFVVTLLSVILGLGVVAPGLGIAAAAIMLPAVARTAIVLRHTAPAGALAAKLAAFGTSCCVGAVVAAVAAAVCGFTACWVVGVPSGFAVAMIASLLPRSDGEGALFNGGGIAGVVAGCAMAVFIAYRMMLQRAWVPVPVETISRQERRFLLGALVLTAIGTVAGVIAMVFYYA